MYLQRITESKYNKQKKKLGGKKALTLPSLIFLNFDAKPNYPWLHCLTVKCNGLTRLLKPMRHIAQLQSQIEKVACGTFPVLQAVRGNRISLIDIKTRTAKH